MHPEFPRARALLDPPGPRDSTVAAVLLGLAAVAVGLRTVGRWARGWLL